MIQELLARRHIENRLAQHARGIDRADEHLLRAAYHDDGTVDYGSLKCGAADFASAIASMHAGAPMSLHRPSNVWIKVKGQQAVSESYVAAWVTLPTDGDPLPHLVGGRYLDRHAFKDDAWRMQHRHYVLEWIIQYPCPQVATPPAFATAGLVPHGGHHLQDAGNALLLAYAARRTLRQENCTMDDNTALDRLVSHQSILDLGYQYARGVDRGDAAMIAAAFHEDAVIVSGVFNGLAHEFAQTISGIIDGASSRVMHTVTNHWVEINGDSAVGESYVLAYQGLLGDEPKDALTGGRYIDQYERRAGSWKIAHRTFVLDWVTSSPSKNLLDTGMFQEMTQGQRGQQDPVYALWESLD